MLEDCGHVIEVQGLEGWLKEESFEIGMKQCPLCKQPIYTNRRYQNIILETYKDVKQVKDKYYKHTNIKNLFEKIQPILSQLGKFLFFNYTLFIKF